MAYAFHLSCRSEKTRLGKELSGALIATLAGMFMANIGEYVGRMTQSHTSVLAVFGNSGSIFADP